MNLHRLIHILPIKVHEGKDIRTGIDPIYKAFVVLEPFLYPFPNFESDIKQGIRIHGMGGEHHGRD
jgi:hypothetical protein